MNIVVENMSNNTKAKGNLGENVACKFLIKNGFSVLDRNYSKKWGELDIVAIKDKIINFFEVKSVVAPFNNTLNRHSPEENVHPLKVGHIRRMVQTYCTEHNLDEDREFSFHILCVYMDMDTRRARIKWLKDIIL